MILTGSTDCGVHISDLPRALLLHEVHELRGQVRVLLLELCELFLLQLRHDTRIYRVRVGGHAELGLPWGVRRSPGEQQRPQQLHRVLAAHDGRVGLSKNLYLGPIEEKEYGETYNEMNGMFGYDSAL